MSYTVQELADKFRFAAKRFKRINRTLEVATIALAVILAVVWCIKAFA